MQLHADWTDPSFRFDSSPKSDHKSREWRYYQSEGQPAVKPRYFGSVQPWPIRKRGQAAVTQPEKLLVARFVSFRFVAFSFSVGCFERVTRQTAARVLL